MKMLLTVGQIMNAQCVASREKGARDATLEYPESNSSQA